MNEIRFYDSWEDSVAERCKPLSSLIHGGHVSASVLPERLTPHFKKHTKKWGWKTGFWCQKIRATLDRRRCDSCWRPKPCRRTSDAGNHPCSWSLASVNENPQRDAQKLEAWIERCSLFLPKWARGLSSTWSTFCLLFSHVFWPMPMQTFSRTMSHRDTPGPQPISYCPVNPNDYDFGRFDMFGPTKRAIDHPELRAFVFHLYACHVRL